VSGDKSLKPGFAGFGGLIAFSLGLAAIAWILDSILDSIIFNEGTLIGQLLSPTAHEIGIRVLFGSVLIVFGIYTQFNMGRRKQAEESLKGAFVKAVEEKNRSEAIIAALGDGLIIQDTDYKIIYQNTVQNELFGNRIGEYCYKAYEGRDTICEWCPVEKTFRDGKIHRTERAVNTGNGISYYELISSPLRDSEGKIIAGVKVVRNITGLKRTEQELRESERFLADVFASIQDGIGIIDKDMNILRVNPTAEKWYPHTKSFVGRKCYEAYHGRSERCKICPAWETLRTGESAHEIVSKHGPDGKEIGWLEIYSYPLTDTTTGEMNGIIEYVRDITGRKRMEEDLRQSEEKYRMLVENIQEGVFIIQDAKFQYGNEAFARTAGYQAGEIIGMNFRDFVAPEDLEMVTDRYSRRQAGENVPAEYEFHMVRKDGTKIVVNMNVGLVTYRGRVSSMGILKDITESKRIEKALRESEEKYRVLFEAAPMGIGISDLKGNMLDCNQSMQDMTGFTLEELKSNGIGAAYVDSDERKILHKTLLETGSVRNWEIRLKHKDGTIYYALLNVDVLELKGNKVLLATARDITERKQAEEKIYAAKTLLDKTFSSLNEVVLVVDPSTRTIIDCNPAVERVFGYSKDEVIGKNTGFLHVNRTMDEEFGKWLIPVLDKSGMFNTEYMMKRKDGSIFFTENTVTQAVDEKGQRIYIVSVVRDITERKQTEEALRKSMSMLRKAQEIGQMGSWEWDMATNELTWSDEIYKLYGLDRARDRPNYDTIIKTLTPESRDRFIKTMEDTLKHGKTFDGEYALSRPDGSRRYTHTRGEVIRDKDGNPVRMLGIVQDITERKQVEKEKERLFKAIDSSTDGITIADEKDRYIYVNAAYARAFGYTQEELVGNTWRKITPPLLIAPTEKGLSGTMHNRDVGVFNGEVPGLRKDGTEIPTEVRGTALWDENGNYTGHICIVRDITERKKVEEKLRLLSEAVGEAPDGVQIVDLNGFIIYSNRAVEDIYGFSPDELTGKHVNEMNADPEFAVREILPNIKTKGRWIGELIAKKKNGQEFPIWLTTSMVKNSNEEPIAMVGVIRDMTERKRAEEKIRNYTRDLEESNRMKELFADIMHHDLLNPLNTANGFIELLKEDETISRKKAYLETIERSLVKGMELIDSAMKFSNFESLKNIELEEMDLKKIIEEVIEALTPLADNAGMEIVNRITLKTPVRANKIIEEVFSNLISNAIKYASSGKRIIIESENQGESLQVRVIDFGEGIKESDKTMIFERFRRGGKTGVKGSGLGLAIAGKIMELHNGRIWVEDNPDGGSVFIVEIPGNR
jgi:PAS domain S-box-containing protein